MRYLLPFLCPLCKKQIYVPSPVCKNCLKSLHKLQAKSIENFIFRYEGISTLLLRALRNQQKSSILWLSKLCTKRVKSYFKSKNFSLNSIDYLVTIPSYSPWYKYYQPKGMEHITRYLSAELNIPYLEFLLKKKKHSQHKKKSYDRYDSKPFIHLNRKNISFHKKNILLLDDVYTSGTTSFQAIRLMEKESHVFQFYICRRTMEKSDQESILLRELPRSNT